ncbi:unnamed protein product [Caenorhabditis angaria]|uniref:Uncharacterized protein n=1 Tax=Caenorhabditis angaria TaxID=860376 RepID=A0A9P1N2F1_9PELO|nr:unnamed protein product [Caenorhabditis angaria]
MWKFAGILFIPFFIRGISGLTPESKLRWLPPLYHDWRKIDIPLDVKMYWENRWAKAFFAKGCSHSDNFKIIPVYYWPGDRVDLTCRMCHLANIMNGRMKRWGYSSEIEEFLRNPIQLVRVNENWKTLENSKRKFDQNIYTPDISSVVDAPIRKILKDEILYWQNEGKLTIFNSDVSNQGIYFCYDPESKKNTHYFYLLMAMLPPIKIASSKPTFINDNCGYDSGNDDDIIGPSHNWKYHFMPMASLYPPQSCLSKKENDCEKYYDYLNKTNYPKNFDEDCGLENCRAQLIGPHNEIIDMFIEMRWDEYTSCEGEQATKRREAHCYLKRGTDSLNYVTLSKKFDWLENLDILLSRSPFNDEGVRLFSSVVTSAIFKTQKITACYSAENKDGYIRFDEVWRQVFLRSMGVKEKGNMNQLKNPFEACIRYGREEEEHIQGTYSFQVEYC